jgi:filamentous hemagglutinin family protein
MEVPMTRKQRLTIGCAAGSLFVSAPAFGQAFNANPVTFACCVAYDRATPGVETISVLTPTAVIDWTPNVVGDPLVFLPAGNVATFNNGINNTDFVVLNRIVTTVPVRFDGTVVSRLIDFANGTSSIGGTVLFSSPNGIIIGPTGQFDVGNLVLTSLSVEVDAGGNFYDPATRGFRFFGGDTFPNAAIVTEPGARLRALNEGSYIAMLAPRVQHGGLTRVNGGAAYVAAEQVEFRANQGLFDILIPVGSANATPLVHTGSTGGPASAGAGDDHRIYLVAVPKNQAITAILEGNVGFDDAAVVGVENGAIVLSAGYGVAGGEVDRFGDFGPAPLPDLAASFEIRGGTVRSDLIGAAVTDMLASAITTGNLAFLGDVSLFADARAHLSAGAGQTVTVAGNALLSTAETRDLAHIDMVGGESLIFAQTGGMLDISGNAVVDSSAKGVVDVVANLAGHGTGGTSGATSDGGTVRVRGDLSLLATGEGGVIDFAPNRGGTGTGGDALVDAANGGAIGIGGTLTMNASGAGSRSSGMVAIPGANGSGGDVSITATGNGRIDVSGAAALTSSGRGGNVLAGAGIDGGTGNGGTIVIDAGGPVTFTGNVAMTADAAGGTGPNGGAANGGTLILAASPAGAAGGGTLKAPDITGTANATGAAATGNSQGEWHVRATGGGTVALANLDLGTAVNGPPAATPFSSLEPQGGRIQVTGQANLATPADILVLADGGGAITGGRFDLKAGGDVAMTHGSPAPGGFTFDVTSLFVTAGDDFSAADGIVTRTATQTELRATDNANVAGQVMGRTILIESASLDIAGTGLVGSPATLTTELRTTGASTIAGGVLGSDILVTAAGINVTPIGAVGDATSQESELRAVNGLDVSGTVLGRNLILDATAISVPGTVGGAATDQATLTATGATTVAGRVLGGDILVTAAGIDVTLTGAVGDAASQEAELRAANAVNVAGTMLGTNIILDGATIDVPGTVGGAVTTRATLTATGDTAVAGRVLGSDILITATGIGVAPTGAVGDAATQETELRASNNASLAGSVLGTTVIVDAAAIDVAGTGIIGGAGTSQTSVTATGGASVTGSVQGGDILIASATLNLAGTGIVGSATGATRTELRTTGASSLAGRVLGSDILVTADGINVTPSGAVGDGAAQEAELRAVNALDVAGTVLGRTIILHGATINVPGTGTVGGGATNQTTLTSTGVTTIAGRVLGGDILVTAGGINVSGAVGDAATTAAELRAANAVDISGTVLGRNIIAGGGTVNVAGTGIVGGAATNQTSLTAAGPATVAGQVRGTGIRIASADIDLPAGGSVGDAATQLAVLQVVPPAAGGQPTVLGGTAAGPGYTLTNAEAGRIRAGTLRILAPAVATAANRPPDLSVRDLGLNGSGAANGVGALEIVTPGIARVEGALLLSNAGAGGSLSFTAQQRLEVVTPDGGIRVRDAGGGPAGAMILTSDNLWVASPAILDLLRADPDYAGRDDDLIDNGGTETPRGFVEANGVTLVAANTLFVQNSGATTASPVDDIAYAGITVGAGGLTVRTTGAAPAMVSAFGRRLNADGSFTNGDTFFFQVDFETTRGSLAAGYTAPSEFNNCIIVTGQCGLRLPQTTGPGGPDPTTGPTGGSDSILPPRGAEDDDLIDTSFSAEGLIEEPVTSGGESNLWSPDCDRDDDGDCDEGGQ